jgi:hypothetical protein
MIERKRSNSKRTEAVKKIDKTITPLKKQEADLINRFMATAETYLKLKQQKMQYEFLVKKMEETRLKIQKGEITEILVPVAPNTNAPLRNKKAILKYMDEQLSSVKNGLQGIVGQLEFRRDEFIEKGLHLTDWCENRFNKYSPKKISNFRGKGTTDKEKVLFETDFDKMDKEAFKKAAKKAVELNKQKE